VARVEAKVAVRVPVDVVREMVVVTRDEAKERMNRRKAMDKRNLTSLVRLLDYSCGLLLRLFGALQR
jgi:hypothetical protein